MEIDLATKADVGRIETLLTRLLEKLLAIDLLAKSTEKPGTTERPYMLTHLPKDFTFSIQQAAMLAGCSPGVIRRNIKRHTDDRYYLKSHQNTRAGAVVIYAWDFEDYMKRTQIGTAERSGKKRKAWH